MDRDLPNSRRVLLALGAGALVGAGMTGLGYTVPVLAGSRTEDTSMVLLMGLLLTVYSLFFWGAGLLCLGLPAWYALLRTRLRGPGAAIALGAGSSLVAAAILFRSLELTALIGQAGAAAGWSVWRVAYRSAD